MTLLLYIHIRENIERGRVIRRIGGWGIKVMCGREVCGLGEIG